MIRWVGIAVATFTDMAALRPAGSVSCPDLGLHFSSVYQNRLWNMSFFLSNCAFHNICSFNTFPDILKYSFNNYVLDFYQELSQVPRAGNVAAAGIPAPRSLSLQPSEGLSTKYHETFSPSGCSLCFPPEPSPRKGEARRIPQHQKLTRQWTEKPLCKATGEGT